MKSLLITSLLFSTLVSTTALAATNNTMEAHASKADVREQAVDICRNETQQRYGDGAIKFIANKSIWSKYMQGALVKMKIRPEDSNSKHYYCVVKLDKSVDFIAR
jgi:Ni/Co efflux regulator RcnB